MNWATLPFIENFITTLLFSHTLRSSHLLVKDSFLEMSYVSIHSNAITTDHKNLSTAIYYTDDENIYISYI